jgi:hypothetical protein
MKTKNSLQVFLTTGAVTMSLLLGSGAAQAATVQVDGSGTNATGILGLDVLVEGVGTVSYNVSFLQDTGFNVYDDPPPFDFSGETDPLSARLAVLNALNDEPAVETVGPGVGVGSTSDSFLIGFDKSPAPDRIVSVGGEYSNTWGSGGIAILREPSEVAFYADFTPAVVPVPAAVWLFGSALGLLGWIRKRTTA